EPVENHEPSTNERSVCPPAPFCQVLAALSLPAARTCTLLRTVASRQYKRTYQLHSLLVSVGLNELEMFEWSFAGINTSLPGAGGDDCVNYLPASQRLLETLTITGVFAYLSIWALPRLTFPAFILPGNSNPMRQGLLVIHCIVFGIELGFKCATGSLLWALNPCHILTVLQVSFNSVPLFTVLFLILYGVGSVPMNEIIMLACQPSHLVTLLFRLQMHMLNGPLLALAFPVLNTRQLPFEWTVYFIQHLLLLLIPVLMLDQTTVYSVEPLDDVSWSVLALSLQILYHFLILQPIAL
ncbi:hypothetical protein X801_06067, partial [Opisthorchis viverrini]